MALDQSLDGSGLERRSLPQAPKEPTLPPHLQAGVKWLLGTLSFDLYHFQPASLLWRAPTSHQPQLPRAQPRSFPQEVTLGSGFDPRSPERLSWSCRGWRAPDVVLIAPMAMSRGGCGAEAEPAAWGARPSPAISLLNLRPFHLVKDLPPLGAFNILLLCPLSLHRTQIFSFHISSAADLPPRATNYPSHPSLELLCLFKME